LWFWSQISLTLQGYTFAKSLKDIWYTSFVVHIIQVDQVTADIKAFHDREWKVADEAHFGSGFVWKRESIILVAQEGEVIVGVLEGVLQCGVMHIGTLLVDHTRYRLGIGTALIQEAEKSVRVKGAHKMWLETGKGWDAGKLYESCGFEMTGRLKDHFAHEDYVIYTKMLE
jgi:GNAT superfamily N-acetyltransferase